MSEFGSEISDKEFLDEIRRGLIIIMRAMIRKYRMAWLDFLPRDENHYILRIAERQSARLPESTTLPVANP